MERETLVALLESVLRAVRGGDSECGTVAYVADDDGRFEVEAHYAYRDNANVERRVDYEMTDAEARFPAMT